MKQKKEKSKVRKQSVGLKLFYLVGGAFLLAVNYNLYFVPNSIVMGGTSGLAIIIHELTNLPEDLFLLVTSFFLLIISYIFLGKEQTRYTVIGSILYPVFVSLTLPLTNFLQTYLSFDNILVSVLVSGCLFGFANGIIYKAGFNTGGSDVIVKIINKYAHIQEGKSVLITNIFIILLGGFIFGLSQVVYASMILYISSNIIDKILIGISGSKAFLIHTRKMDKVKEYILKEMQTGVTLIETTGGYSKDNLPMIMCVVSNRDYYLFKEKVLKIDEDAFFVIHDCYEVKGGVKRQNLPFN